MSVRRIVTAGGFAPGRSTKEIRASEFPGHHALRERARPLSLDELRDPATQALIDDLIDTKRAADGAGLAANQVGVPVRIAVVEVEPGNPRYPYKPPIPLTVIVNPEIEPAGPETVMINEGCLSVPGLRGEVPRLLAVNINYFDRNGVWHSEVRRGLAAGTFQHEVDHLDGILFLDRVTDPSTLMTWEEFERHHKAAFVARVAGLPR